MKSTVPWLIAAVIWPVLNLGEPLFILTFIFLYLSAAGGGAWRLDWLFDRTDKLACQ